jgi:hypothetical protein
MSLLAMTTESPLLQTRRRASTPAGVLRAGPEMMSRPVAFADGTSGRSRPDRDRDCGSAGLRSGAVLDGSEGDHSPGLDEERHTKAVYVCSGDGVG